MTNTVMVKTAVQATNIDALNRTAKATTNVANGTPLSLEFPVKGEAFVATVAQTGLKFKIGRQEDLIIASKNLLTGEKVTAYYLEVVENTENVWMACSPEVNKAIVGEVYAGLDPRYFTNLANKPFDAIKLVEGDIIQVSVPFFSVAPTASDKVVTLTGGKFVPSASV